VPNLLIDLPSGPRRRVEEHEVVRFGRDPRLELPLAGAEDRTMSRHVGTFRFHGGDWWLERPEAAQASRSGPLEVMALDGSSRRTVPPGGASLLRGAGAVTFPPRRFTLRFRVEGQRPAPPVAGGHTAADHGGTTMPVMSLTARQVDYVVALAEPELRHTPSARRRQLDEVAALWGVRREAVEAALRLLRTRLVDAELLDTRDNGQVGVTDLVARIAVSNALVTAADLEWADLYGSNGPRSANQGPRFRRSRPEGTRP
jgi:hypothetical protein